MTLLLWMLLAVQPRFLGPPEKKPDAGTARAVQAGEPAPPLSGELEDPAGTQRSFDLAAIVGPAATDPAPAALIAFFAPGRPGCADELQIVRQLAGEYGPNAPRALVAVAAVSPIIEISECTPRVPRSSAGRRRSS